jgi:hypothetical protein
MDLRISIAVDTATPQMASLMESFSGREELHGAMGHRVVRDTSRHVGLWGLSHPNKLGGRRTNYWAGIAGRITPETLDVSEANATMTLGGDDMPGITRAFGEVTITAGTKTPGVKYLALPARSESYGMKPREMPGLVLFWGKGGPGGLAEGVPQTRTRDTKKGAKGSTYLVPGLVMFWFTDSVTQPQDRSLLPSDEDWTESATEGAKEFVDAAIAKSRGGAAL